MDGVSDMLRRAGTATPTPTGAELYAAANCGVASAGTAWMVVGLGAGSAATCGTLSVILRSGDVEDSGVGSVFSKERTASVGWPVAERTDLEASDSFRVAVAFDGADDTTPGVDRPSSSLRVTLPVAAAFFAFVEPLASPKEYRVDLVFGVVGSRVASSAAEIVTAVGVDAITE